MEQYKDSIEGVSNGHELVRRTKNTGSRPSLADIAVMVKDLNGKERGTARIEIAGNRTHIRFARENK